MKKKLELLNVTDFPNSSADFSDFVSSASFWMPEQIPSSAWLEHGRFAFWLVATHRPQIIVELGTHSGYSYFTFCHAVQRSNIGARCFAEFDHWQGDEHANFYTNEVYEEVSAVNDRHYSGFSQLIRSTFDEACKHFEDGSIDLLHIDGRHFYDDVVHDFQSWLPKMSENGIILFHDINVRERNFGVYRFWSELKATYPSFEFFHGYGLGVLGVGKSLPDVVKALFSGSSDTVVASAVRNAYSRLGSAVSDRFQLLQKSTNLDQLRAELSEQTANVGNLEARLLQGQAEFERLHCPF